MRSPVRQTARVKQIAGMFDVDTSKEATFHLTGDLPLDERPWKVGLIVGPSGAGKSTAARRLFATELVDGYEWKPDLALVDEFPSSMATSEITALLGSTGFAAAPSWIRPFATLSNGEQARATAARAFAEAITEDRDLVVLDEFTSVVDRQVAQVASHGIAKAVRKRDGLRFVAVTCHYDVTDWLQPDWVFEPHVGRFTWRSLQRRPSVTLDIHPVGAEAWRLFSKHHYLSASLHPGAQRFCAYVGDQAVAFTSYLHFPHPKVRDIKMGHRLVVLPDWQGLGIAGALEDWLGEWLHERRFRYRNVVAHPGMKLIYERSPRWQLMQVRKRLAQKSRHGSMAGMHLDPRGLSTRSYEYVPARKQPA